MSGLHSKKRLRTTVAVTAALALGLTGALVTAETASAHTGKVVGTAQCVTSTGAGTISWLLNNDYNEPMVVTTSDDAAIPVGTTVAATGGGNNPDTTKTLTENIPAPAAGVQKTVHLQFTWTGDGFQQPNGNLNTQAYTSTAVSSGCTIPDSPTADASASFTGGTCSAIGTVTFSINHATWKTAEDDSVGTHVRTAQADPHYTFPNGDATEDVSYTIASALAINDPKCATQETGSATSTVAMCTGTPDWTISANNLAMTATPGGIWTVTGETDHKSTSYPIGQGYNGPAPDGYQKYDISLADGDSTDGHAVVSYTTTWTPIDPATISCTPPAPIACTVTGVPNTESGDHPPVATAAGVDYRSYHDGHATSVVIPINANAQGITSLSFTDTNVVGYGMFSRLIFDLSGDGGPGYASFSVSPGNTIDQNAVAGVGSKNVLLGKTVAQVAVAYPYNKIVGWGFQTGSSYPGDGTASSDGATLTGTSGDCGNVNYVWPTVTFPTDSTSPATCAADKNAHTFSYTLPTPNANEKYELNADGSRPTAGTYFLGTGQTAGPFTLHTLASAQVQQGSVTFGPYTGQDAIPTQYTDSGKPCYVAPTVVTPVGPTTTDGTCVFNAPVAGSATTFAELVTEQPAGVIAALNAGSSTDGTFTADVSYKLADGAITTFHLGKPVNKTVADCKVLAHTGVEIVGTVLVALTLLALGFFLLFLPWWRRRNNGEMA